MPNPERNGPRGGSLLILAALCLAYIVIGKLGLRLAFAFPSATPVWPGTAIALVALLFLGYRAWPAIFVGAFVVNLTTAGTIATSLGIATGNTLEGVVGAWLVMRFAGGIGCLSRAEGVFKFTLFAALLSTTVSATIGVVSLHLAGLAPSPEIGSMWFTWWLGDASGDLLIAPVLLTWLTIPFGPWRQDRGLEALGLLAGLVIVGALLIDGVPSFGVAGRQLRFLYIPFLTWAAVRFGPREASTATLLFAAIAVWGLTHQGSFLSESGGNSSLLLLQTYMAVAAVMTLMLAAAVAERKEAEAQLLGLATRDPLTGIANYRHLIATLEAEIERSERSGRPFAVLFMDVDGLKQINDRHGHLTGSRALCRVAEMLRDSARVVDTAARYGGDEFALLLPETDAEEAAQVARRLNDRLAASTEAPSVRVSLGIAVHPRDGATPDALIGAADRQLYQLRARVRGEALPIPVDPLPDR